MVADNGKFYEFHRERVVSPPGAPVFRIPGAEIGPEISKELALARVNAGKDVYTLAREDAYALARQVRPGRPLDEKKPHEPSGPTRSKRKDLYYRHLHPGGEHPGDEGGAGHIFFGQRGERYLSGADG